METMRTAGWITLLLLACAGLPGTAAAQPPEARIEAARQRAAAAGLPVSLLDRKVAEGRAKGIPADRIAVAVDRRLDALSRAARAMAGAPVSADDLSVGADALEAGVEPGALGRLAAAAPADRRAVAIAVLTQLVSDGESSERALARVSAALRRGPEALRRLPGEAAASRGRGGPPAGRGPGEARGRGQGGPPAAVPGPTGRPENPGKGKGRGRP
jgi:hypothetical protein